MTEEEERALVQQRTEQNRQAVPATVIHALAEMSVTLDDVLKMSRQDFEAIDNKIYKRNISDEERRYLIRFKHDSMTHAENLAYFEPTDAEWDEMEKDQP